MVRIWGSHGQSIVELLVAIGVASIILPALLTGFVTSRQGKVQQRLRLEATSLLKEGEEAVRSVREASWNTFAVNGTFHPVISGSSWTLVSGSETINGFTRSIVISDVLRDATGKIIQSGGTVDPSTKQVVTTVSWSALFPTSVTTTRFFSRYKNLAHTETTVADFTLGTKTNVVITNTSGGEVTLSAGGGSDWCKPSDSIRTTLDLSGQGVTTAISAIPGHAYTTTGGNASGDALDSITITDPQPSGTPSASVAGSYNTYKAYAVFAGTNNIFIGSDHPGLTVIILNPTTLAQVGFFDASGGERPGNSIYVNGNTAYVTAGSKLYAFDVTTIKGSASQTELWSATLSGTGQRVVIVGNYAFVATASTTNQLQIINLTTHAITNFSPGNSLAGVDVYVDSSGQYAYLVTNYASGKNDFFIIDVSNATSPQLAGSYSTNGTIPKGVIAVPGNRAIIAGSGGQFYQVLNTSDKTHPTNCGGLDSSNFSGVTSINAVSPVREADGDVFSYILTDNASREFQIIEGGPGGQFSLSGTFESATFDASASVAFNRFDANAIISALTNLTYQVAASDPVSGSCNGTTFTFVGPDGTNATSFATSSAIPLSTGPGYKNPSQCFRYRAYLSASDSAYAPVFTDMTVNYSP